jgi:hypothetical protein
VTPDMATSRPEEQTFLTMSRKFLVISQRLCSAAGRRKSLAYYTYYVPGRNLLTFRRTLLESKPCGCTGRWTAGILSLSIPTGLRRTGGV